MLTATRQSVSDLKRNPWCAATQEFREKDSGFDALAQAADEKISEPTILLTRAEYFEGLTLECLRHRPAFVIWLPQEYSELIFDLAHSIPSIYTHTSPDLKERELMIRWEASGISFAAAERHLHSSLQWQKNDGAISVIFATDACAAMTAWSIDADFWQDLSDESSHCGEHYCPSRVYTPYELSAAAERRGEPYEYEFDAEGRRVILLRPRRAVRPDRIV